MFLCPFSLEELSKQPVSPHQPEIYDNDVLFVSCVSHFATSGFLILQVEWKLFLFMQRFHTQQTTTIYFHGKLISFTLNTTSFSCVDTCLLIYIIPVICPICFEKKGCLRSQKYLHKYLWTILVEVHFSVLNLANTWKWQYCLIWQVG